MSEHTPGPWSVDGIDPYNKAFGVSARDAEGYKTPVVTWRGMARPASDEGKANARLISAAPDLLEALIELKEWIENDCGAECPSDKARDAIAKAEGRS